MDSLNVHEKAALDRLIAHAMCDSGQSAKVANFLLAWWNADTCGAFDPREMWGCDQDIVDDMVTVFRYVGNNSIYPDKLGYEAQFVRLVKDWRPELGK